MAFFKKKTIPAFRNLPKAPCTWCGGLSYNGHLDGSIHCAECESGEANFQGVKTSWKFNGIEYALTAGHAGRIVLVEHGYVRRWTLALDSGYTPGSASRLANMYLEVIWTHEQTSESSESEY